MKSFSCRHGSPTMAHGELRVLHLSHPGIHLQAHMLYAATLCCLPLLLPTELLLPASH